MRLSPNLGASALWLLCLVASSALPQEKNAVRVAQLELRSTRPPTAEGEWVRCGCPLPAGAAVDTDALRLVTAGGAEVPAHFRALSRWGGTPDDAERPLKWVEITFAARRGLERLELLADDVISEKGRVIADDDGERLRIENGELKLVLRRGTRDLIESFGDVATVLDAAPAGRILFENEAGRTVQASPWRVTVESADDAAATVLAEADLPGLELSLRLHVVEGAGQVVLDFRLVNRGPYGHLGGESAHVYFKRLGLTLPRPRGALQAAVAPNVKTELGKGQTLALMQVHETPPEASLPKERLPFSVWVGGRERTSGQRAKGVVALKQGESFLGVSVERFWENAPKALAVVDEAVLVDFFPAGGHGPEHRGQYGMPPDHGPLDPRSAKAYRFEGARAKTTRMLLTLTREKLDAGFGRLLDAVDRPLHALPSPADVLASGAVGYLYDLPDPSAGVAAQRFERILGMLVDDNQADPQPNLGTVGYPRFVERGGTYGTSVFFGWLNYGDIPWGDGYCSLHYDWPFVVLLQYLRTGDARFFELGREMARHRRDIDQDHDTTSRSTVRGGQFYEKGWWHGNYYHPSVSHTWVMGPLLHYLLTGDEGSREAVELDRDFIHRRGTHAWDGSWGSRIPGWSVESLMALHWVLFEARDLEQATRTIRQFERVEKRKYGGRGFVFNDKMKPPAVQPWMHNIVFNAVAKHALMTGSKEFHPLLERMLRFFRKRALTKPAAGQPRRVFRSVGARQRREPSIHLAWPMAASFSWAYALFGRDEDRDMARELFTGASLWYQNRPSSPISFRMLNYPNAESKILSNIGLWGVVALPALRR